MAPPGEPRFTWIAPAEDPGARLLVPGCMEQVQGWDAAELYEQAGKGLLNRRPHKDAVRRSEPKGQ